MFLKRERKFTDHFVFLKEKKEWKAYGGVQWELKAKGPFLSEHRKVGNKGREIAEGSMNFVPSFCVKGPITYEKNTMSEGLQNLIFGSGETLKTVDYFSKLKKKGHMIVILFAKREIVQIFS